MVLRFKKKEHKIITPYTLLLISAFCYSTLLNYIAPVLRRLSLPDTLASLAAPAILVVLIGYQLFINKKIIFRFSELLVLLVVPIVVAGSYFLFPNTRPFFSSHNMTNVFYLALPFYVIGIKFRPDSSTMNALTYASYLAIIVNVLYLFYFVSFQEMIEDNMHWAYLLLPHIMLSESALFSKEIKMPVVLKAIFPVLGLLYLISLGSRGPILIALLYMGIVIFKSTFRFNRRGVLLAWALLLGLGILVLSDVYIGLLMEIKKWMEELGLSTRALDLFFEGEYISYTSGRDNIFAVLWEKIRENPFGYGVFAEWEFIGYSAHNLFFQLCMHYGLFGGTALLIAYIVLVVKAYFRTNNEVLREFILLYAVFTFTRGIFGGDYFSDYSFFLLGLCLHTLISQKKKEPLPAAKPMEEQREEAEEL